ncbi:MAG: rolling circle replication-associated protein [Anaerovoracaceae bacterium]
MAYRQKKYTCGSYREIEIYPYSDKSKTYARAKTVKDTAPAQRRLNTKNAIKYFRRLILLNFAIGDLVIHLTYDDEHLPYSKERMNKDFQNYVARLRRYLRNNGLPELKYVAVFSDSNGKGRPHIHMVLNSMDRNIAEQIWKRGKANCDRLQFDDTGITELASYIAGQGAMESLIEDVNTKSGRRWRSSINLKKPEAVVSDKAINKSKFMRMENSPDDRAYFEKLYPGWQFTDCEVIYRESYIDHITGEIRGFDSGPSIFIRMRKYPKENQRKSKASAGKNSKTNMRM